MTIYGKWAAKWDKRGFILTLMLVSPPRHFFSLERNTTQLLLNYYRK